MMKKSIFAVAVASVMTLGAAQAETVLYGSIRYDYQSKKDHSIPKDNHDRYTKLTSQRVSNLADAGSRIGVQGSEDLGNNNAVIYQLEWGFDGMTQNESEGWKTRKAILGVTGDWGTVTAGRQDNPFKNTIVEDTVTDGFNGSDVISSAAQRAMTSTLEGTGVRELTAKVDGKEIDVLVEDGTYFSNTGPLAPNTNVHALATDAKYGRVGKVIAYTTPDFAGFQANAAIMMDSGMYAENKEKNIDLWTVNAKYSYDLGANGAILAKAGYIQGKVSGNENKSKAWGLMLGYNQDAFGVTASYADGNYKDKEIVDGSNKIKSKGWDLGGRYSFGPNYFSTIRVAYGQSQIKEAGEKDKVKSWAVGFEQKLSSRTRAWVEYGREETKFSPIAKTNKIKNDVVSIGMRHDF